MIGGGSGGVRAARLAAGTGAQVVLAEEYRLGGTCVIRGCVPKKLMYYASGYASAIGSAEGFGWDVQRASFDWKRFKASKDAEITRLEGIYERLLCQAGVKIVKNRATILDPHTVKTADETEFKCRHILVATGGRPRLPRIPGVDLGISSNEIFELERLPGRILIVGGGYIACEFAAILAGMGCDVVQCYRGDQILRGFDDDIREVTVNAARRQGIDLRLRTDLQRIERKGQRLLVWDTDLRETEVDQILFAIGREPSTVGIGLEDAGVGLGPRGEILVNAYSQSSIPSIFAVGDVTDRLALTPVAVREGAAFVATVFEGVPTRVDHELVPTAVFTRPEIGTVGLTEAAAASRGAIEVYLATFRPMSDSLSGKGAKCLMKLVVDAESRIVLGVHIVGDGASEMIQLAAVAVKLRARKEDFDQTVAVHPTSAEELVTLREPVRTT